MSEKKRRDITLGEMQDECKRVFGGCALCRVKNECAFCLDVQPAEVDLTDPPRFTEAQMALLKALWDFGIRSASNCGGGDIYFYRSNSEPVMAVIDTRLLDENDIDLAELFGKEETK